MVSNAEHGRDLGYTADLHDHHQDPHLGGSELVSIGDDLQRVRQVQRRLADEDRGGRRMRNAGLAPGARGESQNMGDEALAGA